MSPTTRSTLQAGLAACLGLMTALPASASEWWMLHQTETGQVCAPSLEVDGIALTPRGMLADHPECKLRDETPSYDLDTVMIDCKGRIGRVFVFTRNKAACERLIAE